MRRISDLRASTGQVDALALTLVQQDNGGPWEHRFMLIGDVLVSGSGQVDTKGRYYTVDVYNDEEAARNLLLAYMGDHDTEGWELIGGVVNFTVSEEVYESVRDMNDHRGPSPLLDQLFDVAARMVD